MALHGLNGAVERNGFSHQNPGDDSWPFTKTLENRISRVGKAHTLSGFLLHTAREGTEEPTGGGTGGDGLVAGGARKGAGAEGGGARGTDPGGQRHLHWCPAPLAF